MTTDSDFSRLDDAVNDRRDESNQRDRRASDKEMAHLVREMFKVVSSMRNELANHIAEEGRIFNDAFPGGDPVAHRRAHEAWIKREEDKTKFQGELLQSVVKWGLFGVLGFLLMSAWEHFLRGPK